MDLKEAYEIMDLTEDSSIEELEKRFDFFVRRNRGKTSEEDVTESEKMIKAYKTIKDAKRQGEINKYNDAKFGTNIRKKERSEKRELFWLHHRWKVIAIVVGIGILSVVGNIVINSIKQANLPKPALEIMMYGDYYGGKDEDLQKAILTKYPDWKRVKAIVNYLPGESSNSMDPAFVQKSFVVLATERPDVYILDKTTFQTMLAQNTLVSMDEWKTELGAQYTASQLITGKQETDTEAHVYGVDITNDPMWKTLGLELNDKIAVRSMKKVNEANAKRFIINF
ncbi:hypothetical protein EHS13_02915 [Paenibacillus psychroresistens]|uniref:J domain-containing protein n=1 Tax=Paenibacillus psychroresistens TaxID=1778678 RepID=A0A6B8RER7_9BACL|nr:hypothetical protein [Paenibacillus psychroresistens]QGQ93928.1 hypothetical protein EHS13_02915 [Paenibacillus psychroresistens]